jgi:signal transduction histidine kinase
MPSSGITLGSGGPELPVDATRLDELVDRGALRELVESSYGVFRIPMRVLDSDGSLLAATNEQLELYAYLDTFPAVRSALNALVLRLKTAEVGDDGTTLVCLTGASYMLRNVTYDGRTLGRLVIGPFAGPDLRAVSAALFALDASIDPERVAGLVEGLPRSSAANVTRMARYLCQTLDLIAFSGHKALLTGSMHLAAMRESYRELQDRNARLQHAYDRLKELDRLKSNFLATVSHELRTPLTSIIGYSEMLSEGIAGELSVEQAEFVQTIRDKGEQLLALIKGLLDLSKLESGTMSLRKADVSAQLVMEDVAQTLAPVAKKKGIALTLAVEPGLPSIWGDKERIRQVLLNLTENALKFTESGGRVVLSASVTAMDAPRDHDGGGLVLMAARRTAVQMQVADTGIGIPALERDRVFDAFYQVDSSSTREQGGTGLGLSIVKRLVDAHDGTVQIEQNVPSGTVFVVTIPCRRASMM